MWRIAASVSALTALAQIGQLAIQLAIAWLYGTSAQVDAFAAAVTLPNLLAALIIGTSSQLVVPALAKRLAQSREAYTRARNALLVAGGAVVAILAAVPAAGGSFVISVVAPGLSEAANALAPRYLVWAVVALVPGALSAYLAQTHALREQFRLPRVVGLGGIAITLACFVAFHERLGLEALLLGQLAGAGLGAVALLLSELRTGRGSLVWRDPLLAELAWASLPVALVAASTHLNVAVDRFFASTLASGSLATLHYADRWLALTQAVLAMPVVMVLYTRLSREAASGGLSAASARKGVSAALFIGFPLAAWTLVAAPDLAGLFLARHEDPEATRALSDCLRAYAGVLALLGLGSFLVRAFYADGDTRTPFWFAGVIPVVFNVILDWALVSRFGLTGLAAVTSINALVGLPLLCAILGRRIGGIWNAEFLGQIIRILLASLILGGALYGLRQAFGGEGIRADAARLAVLSLVGPPLYIALSWALGTRHARELLSRTSGAGAGEEGLR